MVIIILHKYKYWWKWKTISVWKTDFKQISKKTIKKIKKNKKCDSPLASDKLDEKSRTNRVSNLI